MSLDIANSIFNEALLLVIGYVLMLKGLNMRRFTPLGRAIAINNIMFAITYFSIAFSAIFGFVQNEAWLLIIRIGILITATFVLNEMQQAFGGWRALHRRAWQSAVDLFKRNPQRESGGATEGY